MSTQAEFVPTGTNVFSVPGAVIRHPANNPLNQTYMQANAAFGIDPNVLARERFARQINAPVQFSDPYIDDPLAAAIPMNLAGFGSYTPPTNVGTRSAYAQPYDYTRSLMVSDRVAATRMGMTPPYGSYTGAMLPPSQLGHMNPAAARSFAMGLGVLGRARALRHGMGGLGFSLLDPGQGLSLDSGSSDGASSDTFTSSYASGAALPGAASAGPSLDLNYGSNPVTGSGSIVDSGTTSPSSGASNASAGSTNSQSGGVLSTISNIFGSVAKTTTAVLGQKPASQSMAGGVSPAAIAALAVGGLVLTIATVKILGKKRPAASAA